MIELNDIEGFGWDEGNKLKSFLKHNVSTNEVEEVFHCYPLLLVKSKLVNSEERFLGYGKTKSDRFITVVFVIRNKKIRIISARHQSKKEREEYLEKTKKAIEANSGIQIRR